MTKAEILMLIGLGLLAFYAWRMFKHYKATEPEKRAKLMTIYLSALLLSIVIFVGIKIAGLPEKLNSIYGEPQKSEASEIFKTGTETEW